MTIEVGRVAMAKLSDIEIGTRVRQEMGSINELESSMKEIGLIQPLAVMEAADKGTGKKGKYYLLAGERRVIVLRKNEVEDVPIRIYPPDISELEMKTIEMAENFYRKDMEYWEYDNIIREMHGLRQQIHGVKPPGPGDTGWGVQDTADAVGVKSKATVTTAIKRAEARETFPELFEKCKTQHDASKVLKKMDEAVIKHAIAQKLEADGATGDLKRLADAFVLKDFFEGVKKVPDGIMHLVEVDPPYGIDLAKAKKRDGESIYGIDDYNEIDKDSYGDFLHNTFKECYRVMSDHSWLLCWFAPEPWWNTIYVFLKGAGFETTRMCGIWTKPSGQTKRPEIHLANAYEMFFYAWKGRPAMNKAGRSNVFDYSPVPPPQKTHPTERPIELMRDIYETFAFPGSRILIPFLGSGSGLIAAHELGMSATGFEMTKAYRDSFLVKVHGMRT